jgi:hypothetical protein
MSHILKMETGYMSLIEAEFCLLRIVTMFELMEVLVLKRKLDKAAPAAYEENKHGA